MVTLGAAAPVFLVGMVAAGAFMGAGVGFAAMGAATHDWNQAVRSAQVGAIGGAIGGLASGGVMLGVAAFSTAGLGGGVVAGNAAHAVMRAGLGGQVLMGVTGGVSGGFAGGFSGSVVGDWAAGQGVNWGNAWMAGLTGGALGGALGAAVPLAWAGVRAAGSWTARGTRWTASLQSQVRRPAQYVSTGAKADIKAANRKLYDAFIASGGKIVRHQRSIDVFDSEGLRIYGEYSAVENRI